MIEVQDERSLLELASDVVAVISPRAPRQISNTVSTPEEAPEFVDDLEAEICSALEEVSRRELHLSGIVQQLEDTQRLLATKVDAKLNAPEFEVTLRRLVEQAHCFLLLDAGVGAGLIGLDARLSITQIRHGLRKGVLSGDRFDQDIGQVERLASNVRLLRTELDSSAIQTAITILSGTDTHPEVWTATLEDFKQIVDAVAVVVGMAKRGLAAVAQD